MTRSENHCAEWKLHGQWRTREKPSKARPRAGAPGYLAPRGAAVGVICAEGIQSEGQEELGQASRERNVHGGGG